VKRLALLAVLVAAVATVMGGFHEWTPPAHAATQAPSKLAVIVLENKTYVQTQKVSDGTDPSKAAPWINSAMEPDAWSSVPTPSGCNYPSTQASAGTGTSPCTAGMFNSYRCTTGYKTCPGGNFLSGGSAPEYAFLSMASDANVRDGKFPYSTGDTGTNGNIVGYTPNTACTPISGSNGECASGSTYNVFDYMDAHSVTWKAYAEDYGGTTSTCDVKTFNPANTSNFYARRHVAPMETWDIVPDAKQIGPMASAPKPDGSSCKANVANFPNNTPGSSTAVATNFDGTQTFPHVTYIFPSMCHMGHNDNGTCGGTSTDFRGNMRGIDRWLQLNLPGIRKDVGQDGAVIVTFDEAGASVDESGKAPPTATWILPGTDSSGNQGVLTACGDSTQICQDRANLYDVTSVAKTVMQYAGGSCSNFDNTVTYQGQPGTAKALCDAATPLPISVEVGTTPTGPSVDLVVPGSNGAATSSVSAAWPAAQPSGDFLIAAVACKGTCGTITGPTGWTQAETKNNAVSLWYCANCTSSTPRTGTQTWTWLSPETHRGLVIMADVSGVSTSAARDVHNTATSGSTSTDTTALSGTTGATSQASEVAFSAYMTNLGGIWDPPASSCNTGWDEVSQGQQSDFVDLQLNWNVLTASQSSVCSQSDFDEATTWRGVVSTFTN